MANWENQLNEEKASVNNNWRNGETKKTVPGLNTGTFELEIYEEDEKKNK